MLFRSWSRKHDALWCLGNAETARAFSAPDQNEARVYFKKASQCFQKALIEEPGNDLYRKSFEVAAKTTKKNKNSDLKHDVCGWIILAVGIFAWLRYAKSYAPPPPLPQ